MLLRDAEVQYVARHARPTVVQSNLSQLSSREWLRRAISDITGANTI